MHTSYLPHNKVAHPNFWSFIKNTPKGVSIHEMTNKLDCGPIVYRKKVNFSANENSYRKTYIKLINEAEKLFKVNIKKILEKKYKKKRIKSKGTFHLKKDLPKFMKNWDIGIKESKQLFKKLNNKCI